MAAIEITAQEAFDRVCAHLAKQPERSQRPGTMSPVCLYRGPKGMKCAIGALIPDELYEASFEGKMAHCIPLFSRDLHDLLDALQGVHDECGSQRDRAHELRNVADNHGLSDAAGALLVPTP